MPWEGWKDLCSHAKAPLLYKLALLYSDWLATRTKCPWGIHAPPHPTKHSRRISSRLHETRAFWDTENTRDTRDSLLQGMRVESAGRHVISSCYLKYGKIGGSWMLSPCER